MMFEPIGKETVSQAIVRRFTQYLMDGILKPGDRLPPEPELAEQLGVSRTALREALKMLTGLGVLHSKRRGGTYIATSVSNEMLDPLIFGLIIEKGSKDELFEIRYMFELNAIDLAIAKATADDLEVLAANLEAFERAIPRGNLDELWTLDREFHSQILTMSKNKPFIKIARTVEQLFARAMRRALPHVGPETALKNHRAIYQALVERDLETAREIVKTSFLASRDYF
ncbi:MAG: FadR family transcriptional regulator [Peptococcaceae bacterium]|nr:FadR family transcriptional regulator [Peptococcaceae bacterium]